MIEKDYNKAYRFKAKENVDYSKYGFVNKYGEYALWVSNTKRVIIDSKTNVVRFNAITTDVLKVFYDMVRDGVINYEISYKPKTLTLTKEEYDIIMKMRLDND